MSSATIMLASPYKPGIIKPEELYYVSEKLDGMPVLITRQEDGSLAAVSRQGKTVTSINHILVELEELGEIPGVGEHVVGELYIPGTPQKDIRGMSSRKGEQSPQLELHVFHPFVCREHTHIKIVPGTYLFGKEVSIRAECGGGFGLQTIGSPCEGYVAYRVGEPWKAGFRSPNYVKIVERPTLDLLVVDYLPAYSKDGKLIERVGAFLCKWGDGVTKVGAGRLSHQEATDIWNFSQPAVHEHHGQVMVSNSGVPRIIEVGYKHDPSYDKPREPVFHAFRDKHQFNVSFTEYEEI